MNPVSFFAVSIGSRALIKQYRGITGPLWRFTGVILTVLACWFGCQDQSLAQTSNDAGDTQVSVVPSVVQRASGNRWTPLSVVASNPSAEDREEVVSVFVDNDPSIQYATKLWVPAGSSRQTWLSVRVPEQPDSDRIQVPYATMRLEAGPDGEVLRPDWKDSATSERSLLLTHREINTGMMTDAATVDFDDSAVLKLERLADFINLARSTTILNSLELPNVGFTSNFLPDAYGALDQLDQVVISGNVLENDTAGILTLRRWLRRGGRIWIMLDQTDESLVRKLLGDDAIFGVVDTTQLNKYDLATTDVLDSAKSTSETWEEETPVEFQRVFTESNDVTCLIDGWPAAFWQKVGDGEVLFTTLGLRGWLGHDGTPTVGLVRLSKRFYEPRATTVDCAEAMIPVVNDQIGYRVPRRAIATLLLSINAIAMLAGGLIWMRQQRLERIAVLIPVVSVLITGVMLWIGKQNTGSVPTTIAAGQLVVVNDATEEADIQSTFAIYCQNEMPIQLETTENTFMRPQQWASERTKRTQWSDDGVNRWIQPDQSPGTVENWRSDTSMFVTEGGSLMGTFDEQGFVGTISRADDLQIEDAFVASFPAPETAAVIDTNEGNELRVRTEDLLADGQFVSAKLLTDQQSNRQSVLRQLFSDAEQNFLSKGTQCLFWTSPREVGLGIADGFTRKGTALMSVPVKIRRPESGTKIRIPATFVSIDSFSRSRGVSSLFNPRNGKWLTDVTKSTETELLFRFPNSLGSIELKRVHVTMNINAPERTLTIRGWQGDESVNVFEQYSPTGSIDFSVDQMEVLDTERHGGLRLTISVSPPTGDEEAPKQELIVPVEETTDQPTPIFSNVETTSKTWQIDSLILDAEAIVK